MIEEVLEFYRADLRSALRRPALFQRRRRPAGPGRGPPAGIAFDPACAPGRARPARGRQDLRHGLPHPGRHLHPRLHPHRRPGLGPSAGPERPREEGKLIYNLGNGEGYSVREVIETARQVTGHPIPAEETPRRPGDSPRLVASSEKIRKELGWEPEVPALADIIASAWVWHQSHPNGYE